MRILVAPQELKGSLTARQAADAIAAGVARALPSASRILLPLADGGPGTLDALVASGNGELHSVMVSGPLGGAVQARYGVVGGTAIVESAEACGLVLLRPDKLDPESATTRGVGEIIRAALECGCRRFLIGIGGSATNDGGAGMAQALGFHLLDATGKDLPPGAAALAGLERIDHDGVDPRLAACRFEVAVDVRNPLCGPEGATAVYGPQKGVRPDQVEALDGALRRLGRAIERDLGRAVLGLPGGGAAGGLGAGLAGFLGAALRPGFAIVADQLRLEARLAESDLVFTAEGRLDGQTTFGKTIAGLAALAGPLGVPVIALAGGIAPGFDVETVPGLTAAFAITSRPMSLEEAQGTAAELLANAAEQCARLLAAGPRPTALLPY